MVSPLPAWLKECAGGGGGHAGTRAVMGALADTAVTRGSVGCEVLTRGHGRALRYRGDPAVP